MTGHVGGLELSASPRACSEEELTLTRENSIRRLHSSHSTDTRTQVGAQRRGLGAPGTVGGGVPEEVSLGVPKVGVGVCGVMGVGVPKVVGVGRPEEVSLWVPRVVGDGVPG